MTTQTELIEALGGHRELAGHLAHLFPKDGARSGEPSERVRKWKEGNHIPPLWRPYVRAVALKSGLKLRDLPVELLLPEETELLSQPAGNSSAA